MKEAVQPLAVSAGGCVAASAWVESTGSHPWSLPWLVACVYKLCAVQVLADTALPAPCSCVVSILYKSMAPSRVGVGPCRSMEW